MSAQLKAVTDDDGESVGSRDDEEEDAMDLNEAAGVQDVTSNGEPDSSSEDGTNDESVKESDESEEDEDEELEQEPTDEEEEAAERSSNGSASLVGSEEELDEESEEEEEDWHNVWGDDGGAPQKISSNTEAIESQCVMDFQEAISFLTKGDSDKAIHIFKKLLLVPIVSEYHTTEFNWELEREPVDRLSKMARLFIGVHKNLANMCKNEAVDHLLQVLSLSPSNTQLWFELGKKVLEDGDLDMARFAFEKVPDEQGLDALACVHYLMGNYRACLTVCQQLLEANSGCKKAIFLKELIWENSPYFRGMCDKIFAENSDSEILRQVDRKFFHEAAARLAQLQQRLHAKRQEKMGLVENSIEPIVIELGENHSLTDVVAVFCDLFDRIEAHSSFCQQRIIFCPWWDRSILFDTSETIERLLDCVDAVDDLLMQVVDLPFSFLEAPRTLTNEDLSKMGIRRSTRIGDIDSHSQVETGFQGSEASTEAEQKFPDVVGFRPLALPPLKGECIPRPSRTPSPATGETFDSECLLAKLRESLTRNPEGCTIFECISTSLLLLTMYCPEQGILQKNDRDLWSQCYRRFVRLGSSFTGIEWMPLHLLFFELDEPDAISYCQSYSYDTPWPNRRTAERFIWKHSKTVVEELRLVFLHALKDNLAPEDFVCSATGGFCLADVIKDLDGLERIHRINSLKTLKDAGHNEQIADIISSDVDFSSMEDEDILITCEYWMEALRTLHRDNDALRLATRLLQFHRLFDPLKMAAFKELIFDLETIEWENTREQERAGLGYELYLMTEVDEIVGWWPLWRLMYEIAKSLEGPVTLDALISTTASGEGDDDLPSRALSVLIRAHERMGAALCCAQDKGSFLSLYLRELWTCLNADGVRDFLQQPRNSWMLANVCEETAQLLSCAFGKYSKKRRAVEEHGNPPRWERDSLIGVRNAAIGLALPCPLPVYDDKEKLGHDAIDLVLNRFPEILLVDGNRNAVVDQFVMWMHKGEEGDDFPFVKTDSALQANVYYSFALHNYRLSNHEESFRFSCLFLSSGHATTVNPVAYSAWAILAHTTLFRLFQMPDDDMLNTWRWHLLPFRMALRMKPDEAVVHFEYAHTLYQLGTRLSRFLKLLPGDDSRRRRGLAAVEEVRDLAARGFEEALKLHSDQSSDYMWLCFFFTAKLSGKRGLDDNIAKVLDGFYESACSLEFIGTSYPAKIAAKNQKHIEPIEVHYQAHASVYKYITQNDSPSRSSLICCLSFLRALQAHGVCRDGVSSLFTVLPDIHNSVGDMVDGAVLMCERKGEVAAVLDDIVSRVDLKNELWKLCWKGFEVCCERFPHMKAQYRLAEMCLESGRIEEAERHLCRGVFRRKRKEDQNFLEGMVEITSTDISRSGSFCFHTERALRMAIHVIGRQRDHQQLSVILCTILDLIVNNDHEWLLVHQQRSLSKLCWLAFRHGVLSERIRRYTPAVKQNVFKVYEAICRSRQRSSAFLSWLHREVNCLVQLLYGDVPRFAAEMVLAAETKKKAGRKRKNVNWGGIDSSVHPARIPAHFPTHSASGGQLSAVADPQTSPSKLIQQALLLAGGIALQIPSLSQESSQSSADDSDVVVID